MHAAGDSSLPLCDDRDAAGDGNHDPGRRFAARVPWLHLSCRRGKVSDYFFITDFFVSSRCFSTHFFHVVFCEPLYHTRYVEESGAGLPRRYFEHLDCLGRD